MSEQTFGSFLTEKRMARGKTLRSFATEVGISAVYVCNIEKDRKKAPTDDILERIADNLSLSKEDRELFLDLAAKSKTNPMVAMDLPEYINERDIVRTALRTAKDVDATDVEWQEFIEKLKTRVVRDNDTDGG
jgi:transcriptional regulator with XRE-family HTH domain